MNFFIGKLFGETPEKEDKLVCSVLNLFMIKLTYSEGDKLVFELNNRVEILNTLDNYCIFEGNKSTKNEHMIIDISEKGILVYGLIKDPIVNYKEAFVFIPMSNIKAVHTYLDFC